MNGSRFFVNGFGKFNTVTVSQRDIFGASAFCLYLSGTSCEDGMQSLQAKGYSIKGRLGYIVFKGVNAAGEDVAIKRMSYPDQDVEDGVPWRAVRELHILQALSHPNTVRWVFLRFYSKEKGRNANRLIEIVPNERETCAVLEYVPFTLEGVIETAGFQRRQLPPSCVRKVMRGVFCGLAHAHSRGIVHRDIKPRAILLDKEGTPKIAGWGLGRAVNGPLAQLTAPVVTLPYRSPELVLGAQHGPCIDIWSAACVFAEMAHPGQRLFSPDSEIDLLFQIFRLCGTPSEEVWEGVGELPFFREGYPQWHNHLYETLLVEFVDIVGVEGVDLMCKMLCMDPSRRISAKEALHHPYFLTNTVPTLQQQCVRVLWKVKAGWTLTDKRLPAVIREIIEENWKLLHDESSFPFSIEGVLVMLNRIR